MELHTIKASTNRDTKKRVGRGGNRGKTSGRGMKGQKARAGHHIRPAIRDYIKKLPKLRGYNFNPHKAKPETVNLSDLEINFNDKETVNPETLLEKGLVRRHNGRAPYVKVLGKGEIKKSLKVEMCQLSESARSAIESAGGSVSQ